MPQDPLNLLLAFKGVALAQDLSATEKRVASALLDHFNRQTDRCDPSLNTLATLLGINRRTVIRAINGLVRARYFYRTRHGGHFHTNFYAPAWPRFYENEARWKGRRKQHSLRFQSKSPSPSGRQSCHLAGDEAVTQTCPSNQSKLTLLPACNITGATSVKQERRPQKKPPESDGGLPIRNPDRGTFHVNGSHSRDAAFSAAERRWNSALLDQCAGQTERYVEAVELIDKRLSDEATQAELRERGAGIEYIIAELDRRKRESLS